jgi:hypothetical protein
MYPLEMTFTALFLGSSINCDKHCLMRQAGHFKQISFKNEIKQQKKKNNFALILQYRMTFELF